MSKIARFCNFFLLLVLVGVLPVWGQELAQKDAQIEEKVTVIAPEENQKAEAPAPKEKVEAIEKIVVTATKTARNPDDVPASITIITKEDIKKQNIQTVDEALAQVPGAYDSHSNIWGDAMTNVNLRGFPASTQKRTLVLLDGQNISTAYSNSASWISLPVENIERIEVIRGPFSALYGGSAMGGVINIITKTAQKLEMLAQGGYGTYDSWTSYLGAGDRLWNKVSIQGGFNYRTTSGYAPNFVTKTSSNITNLKKPPSTNVVGWEPTRTPTNGWTNIIGDTGDNFWNSYSINGKISWDIASGQKVTFSVLDGYSSYGYDMFNSYLKNTATGGEVRSGTVRLLGTNQQFSSLQESAFLSGNGRQRTQIYNLTSENKVTDNTNLKFHAGLLNQPESWSTTPGSSSPLTTFGGGPGTLTSSPSRNWVAEVQVDQAIGNKHLLVGGLSYNTGTGSSQQNNLNNWRNPEAQSSLNRMSGGRDRNVGIFLQDEIAWHPKFNTVAGIRLDMWETYGGACMPIAGAPVVNYPNRSQSAVSPKIAFLFRPFEWMAWRSSVGTAFRAPTIYELYNTWQTSSGVIYKGNPNLNPETTLSWEVGTTLKPFKGTVFTATYFANYVNDLIYSVTDPADPTGKTVLTENAAKATIEGVELELNQKLCSWLEVFSNTTLVNARITDNPYNPASVGKKITMTPRQQYNFGFTLNYWKILATLSGRYVSKINSRDDNGDGVNNVPGSYDPFFTLNSKIIFTPVKYADLSFAVDNILNRQYFYYNIQPGRMLWTQVTLKY
ncbi:MAG: TonB-dependent receptor [Desulfobaccales bacterium]